MYHHVIFLLVALISFTYASPQFASLRHKREIFCGQKLTDALFVICKGNYASKKSTNDLITFNEYDEDDYGFLPKEVANSLLSLRSRRRSRGVVDECCKKSCTYQHLSLYCA